MSAELAHLSSGRPRPNAAWLALAIRMHNLGRAVALGHAVALRC